MVPRCYVLSGDHLKWAWLRAPAIAVKSAAGSADEVNKGTEAGVPDRVLTLTP